MTRRGDMENTGAVRRDRETAETGINSDRHWGICFAPGSTKTRTEYRYRTGSRRKNPVRDPEESPVGDRGTPI